MAGARLSLSSRMQIGSISHARRASSLVRPSVDVATEAAMAFVMGARMHAKRREGGGGLETTRRPLGVAMPMALTRLRGRIESGPLNVCVRPRAKRKRRKFQDKFVLFAYGR